MALKKRFSLLSGHDYEYFKLVGFHVRKDYVEDTTVCDIFFDAYKDKSSRNNGKRPVIDKLCVTAPVEASTAKGTDKNIVEILYTQAKLLSYFEGAQDD